jgi:hypothetical protein
MPLEEPISSCPICAANLKAPLIFRGGNTGEKHCRNCGTHRITREACEDLPGMGYSETARAGLAHHVSKLRTGELITTDFIAHLGRRPALPGAMERIDLLVRHLAETHAPGKRLRWHHGPEELQARLGCEDANAVLWVLNQAMSLGYMVPESAAFILSVQGWQRHRDLLRDGAGSRHAFMAMKFGDVELDALLRDQLQPAVQRAGFKLRTTVGAHQTAGSIDNRMRVEIRTARFLVCDLTHGNRGAYWEAGFAEGLGRPVFYICRRNVLKSADKEAAPHFDTAHQLIIGWHPDTIDADMAELVATIRATLPAEATMEGG